MFGFQRLVDELRVVPEVVETGRDIRQHGRTRPTVIYKFAA